MPSQSNNIEPIEPSSDEPNLNSSRESNDSAGTDREITLTFLDSTNEQKYERLVKADKLKTTFKRRLTPSESSITNLSDGRESNASPSSDRSPRGKKRIRELETDEGILERRQKQIDYGKNTIGYDLYIRNVTREKRTPDHPWTPQKNLKYSRRAFDGMVKVWRKKLHCYDPANMQHNSSDDSKTLNEPNEESI